MKLQIKRIDKTLDMPSKIPKAAGYNLFARETIEIAPKEIKLVPTNLIVKLPLGFFLLIANRSSTPMSKGLVLANGVGVVDPFYCGDSDEVLVEFMNITDKQVTIEKGERLAQAIIIKYETVEMEEVESTREEGVGGYRLENGKPVME